LPLNGKFTYVASVQVKLGLILA